MLQLRLMKTLAETTLRRIMLVHLFPILILEVEDSNTLSRWISQDLVKQITLCQLQILRLLIQMQTMNIEIKFQEMDKLVK